MENKKCPKCGATWLNGQLYWATGAQGTDADLAGLVCDKYGDETCINSLRGTEHNGDNWNRRFGDLEGYTKHMNDSLDPNKSNEN